jgi:hypothetical protein
MLQPPTFKFYLGNKCFINIKFRRKIILVSNNDGHDDDLNDDKETLTDGNLNLFYFRSNNQRQGTKQFIQPTRTKYTRISKFPYEM